MNDTQTIYVVVSLREYENDETYFSADAVFPTEGEAITYILDDMEETVKDEEADSDNVVIDKEYYMIDTGSHRYRWQIHPFFVNVNDGSIGSSQGCVCPAFQPGIAMICEKCGSLIDSAAHVV